MTSARQSPRTNTTQSGFIRYNNLINQAENLSLNTENVTAVLQPTISTFGDGQIFLNGTAQVTGTPTANLPIASLPSEYTPLQNYNPIVNVLRAGATIANSIAITGASNEVEGVEVISAGSYASMPSISFTGPGSGASLAVIMNAFNPTVQTSGTGYLLGDTITLSGGTYTQQAILVTTKIAVASSTLATAGSGYVPNDLIILGAAQGIQYGDASTRVTTTKVVGATVVAGGSGGTNGTQTVTGTTGTGTPFQASVTIVGGAITTINSITVPGSYTVNPTNITNEPVTGAGLTGAALSVSMGFATGTISSGPFTTNFISLVQYNTSGVGSGVTFNNLLFGVYAVQVSINNPGAYTVLPSNPVSQGSTSGAGTDATFNPRWSILAVSVSGGGSGYTSKSGIFFTGGSGSGGAAQLVLGQSTGGQVTLVNQPQANDIICFDGVSVFVEPYS